MAAVGVVKVRDHGHLIGNGGKNFHQTGQWIVLGHHELKGVLAGFGAAFFYAVHKGSQPALGAFGVLGKLGVDHHFHFAAQGCVGMQRTIKGGPHAHHGANTVFFVDQTRCKVKDIGVQATELFHECRNQGSLATPVWRVQVYNLEAAGLGGVKVSLKGFNIVGASKKCRLGGVGHGVHRGVRE